MPYELDTPIEEALKENRTDPTLGFVTVNKETYERTFTYTESGTTISTTDHWSVKLLNEFPYLESEHPWVVYTCDPEEVPDSFNELTAVGHTLHIYNWDTWKVEEKKGSVAVVTSFEIY
jgi:hypothetical protein